MKTYRLFNYKAYDAEIWSGWMKSYSAKKCDFGQFGNFWTPLGPPGAATSLLKNFCSAQLDMKIQLAAKFENKTDGRLSRISLDRRMNG